jgi:holo-[acyl-carrier protein] synthase
LFSAFFHFAIAFIPFFIYTIYTNNREVHKMIYGIGTDIIEISRFFNSSDTFLKKVYTENELALFADKPQSLAGNFAAKEAVAKAVGTGFRTFSPKDIEILRLPSGAPVVTLYNGASELCGDKIIHISISHNKDTACAFAVIENITIQGVD